MSYGTHFVHYELYSEGILDLCLCSSSCPFSNMVCKSCPFSESYYKRFEKLNEEAKFTHNILKVLSGSTFVNGKFYISSNIR